MLLTYASNVSSFYDVDARSDPRGFTTKRELNPRTDLVNGNVWLTSAATKMYKVKQVHAWVALSSKVERSTRDAFDSEQATRAYHRFQNLGWVSWDQFSAELHNVFVITLCEAKTERVTCTCKENSLHFTCVHSVGIGIKLGHLTLPREAQVISLGKKRSKGRVAKVIHQEHTRGPIDLSDSIPTLASTAGIQLIANNNTDLAEEFADEDL